MADQAIDFTRYRLRRESRKLAVKVAELSTANLAWRLERRALAFLKESRLHAVDLTHVLCTARAVRLGEVANEFFVDGSTVDEVSVRILIRDNSAEQPPSLACIYGKLLTDEEDLVG